jgi:hypothetical protein
VQSVISSSVECSRPGRDLGPGGGYPDDNALSPTLVASLQSRPHDLDISRCVKREIRTAIGHLDNLVHDGRTLGQLGRVDEIGGSKLEREVLFTRVGIDGDDLAAVLGPGTLEDGETDTADTKDGHLGVFYRGARENGKYTDQYEFVEADVRSPATHRSRSTW